MKAIRRIIIPILASTLFAIADETEKLPDFAKAFPAEKFVEANPKLSIYLYATNRDFATLKTQFLQYIGEGWVEDKPVNMKQAEQGYAKSGIKLEGLCFLTNPKFPSIKVKMTQYQLDPSSTLKSAITIAVVKTAEQDGTGQPATRPESKSEGSQKPQPEAEGRSQ
jgi:hypothetical protein